MNYIFTIIKLNLVDFTFKYFMSILNTKFSVKKLFIKFLNEKNYIFF